MSNMSSNSIAFREDSSPCVSAGIDESDRRMVYKIKQITAKGNDAEVRRKKDGTFAVYEVRKNAV